MTYIGHHTQFFYFLKDFHFKSCVCVCVCASAHAGAFVGGAAIVFTAELSLQLPKMFALFKKNLKQGLFV